ncbi:hypothetical protein CW749_03695 [Vibrio sp. vnigr-6D03]|uniref:hypothetical protein n=1 Tax=Vibrio sp. vnigr-6D03 TaxID=2058088 RepID=UPI000C335B53|nr:hypothetical protein [Vibrio sp. vnigr-6D03]PKF80887.1 hypothetical protein CW749_03695 [Vibrio sp. vnigr-6D03]
MRQAGGALVAVCLGELILRLELPYEGNLASLSVFNSMNGLVTLGIRSSSTLDSVLMGATYIEALLKETFNEYSSNSRSLLVVMKEVREGSLEIIVEFFNNSLVYAVAGLKFLKGYPKYCGSVKLVVYS